MQRKGDLTKRQLYRALYEIEKAQNDRKKNVNWKKEKKEGKGNTHRYMEMENT